MAGGSEALIDFSGGAQVAIFAISAKNRDVRTPGLVVGGQDGAISTSARALRTRERARAAWRMMAERGWPLARCAKSRFFANVKKVMCVGPGVRKCVFTTCTVRESVYNVRTRIIRPYNTRHDLFPDPDATLDT